jgi:outer membrane protein OmpA-like peptidoglycan-associated protein
LVEDAAPQVIAAAAAYSMDHPDRPVQVDGFADKNGPPALVADITRQRVQNVIKGLTSNGVPITHIARREVGGVTYSLDSQESRRVVIVVGNP